MHWDECVFLSNRSDLEGTQMSDLNLDPEHLVEKEISSANILRVRVGTNTPCGGDTGHGGRTHVQLVDEASTSWEVEVEVEGEKKMIRVENPHSITIRLGGDSEADTLIEALEFAAKSLRSQQQKKTS